MAVLNSNLARPMGNQSVQSVADCFLGGIPLVLRHLFVLFCSFCFSHLHLFIVSKLSTLLCSSLSWVMWHLSCIMQEPPSSVFNFKFHKDPKNWMCIYAAVAFSNLNTLAKVNTCLSHNWKQNFISESTILSIFRKRVGGDTKQCQPTI